MSDENARSEGARRTSRRRSLKLLLAAPAIGAVGGLFAFRGRTETDDDAAAAALGQVTALRGDAVASREAATRDLALDEPVYDGELIATGEESRLTLRLGERTTIRLGARAEIVIDRYIAEAGGEIELISGPMLFDREPPEAGADGPTTVRGPYGVIAVRGTTFFAGPSRGEFSVFVERGVVEVSARARGDAPGDAPSALAPSVLLSAGRGVSIPAPGAPLGEAREWGAARIREALDSVS